MPHLIRSEGKFAIVVEQLEAFHISGQLSIMFYLKTGNTIEVRFPSTQKRDEAFSTAEELWVMHLGEDTL